MGAREPRRAVADTGPLIHLYEIGSLSVLKLFDEVHVTDTVWAEATTAGRIPVHDLEGLPILHRHALSMTEIDQFAATSNLQLLHAGEQGALLLAERLHVRLFLTDDLAAREAAKTIGLQPVGSLGLIVRAYAEGELDVDSVILRLRALQEKSSLYVTGQIVETAIKAILPPQHPGL